MFALLAELSPAENQSPVTLDTNETLFTVLTAINTCGYDQDLGVSDPLRARVRSEVARVRRSSPEAENATQAMCQYYQEHQQPDPSKLLAQYVSLALYLNPPPNLTAKAKDADMPPDAALVLGILPLTQRFAETAGLHAIWEANSGAYAALTGRYHEALAKMMFDTEIYLKLASSSRLGREFNVYVDPMGAPGQTNARNYGSDYYVVISPGPGAGLKMDQIRHTYLHFEVEPLVYARASAMERLQPLLKAVQDAPVEFAFKSDIVALITECLIKAIEAQTMDVGIPKPIRPREIKQRADIEHFDAEMAAYDRQAEVVRRNAVQLSVKQGWVLVDYFYDKLGIMGKESISLKDDIGEMVYGMDVGRELHKDLAVAFLPEGTKDTVIRSPRQLKGLDLAEMKLIKGDADGAEEMADAALKANPNNAQAHYLAGRIQLIHGDPDEALDHFNKTLALAKDPRTLAWTHIYLGRLYDIARDPKNPDAEHPERPKAIAEYKAALAVRDAQPDTKTAAEKGLKEPFALPKRAQQPEDNEPLDPSGKAEKEAYRPPPRDSSNPAPRLPAPK